MIRDEEMRDQTMDQGQPKPQKEGSKRTWNFSAGPGVLPESVLRQVQDELLDYGGTGCSVLELSHRSREFDGILARATADLRALLRVPEDYHVLWMTGGATAQFAAVVLNLLGDGMAEGATVDYVVTGAWSEKAAGEARRLGATVRTVFSTAADGHSGQVPPVEEWWGGSHGSNGSHKADDTNGSKRPAYVHYCDNETVHGVELPPTFVDDLARAYAPDDVPVVCDMSSNFLSRPVDVRKFGLIYAGAQKNAGPAGVTLVIVRGDLVEKARRSKSKAQIPTILDFAVMADTHSLANTPPTFAIYVCGLVFAWLRCRGGIEAAAAASARRSSALYAALNETVVAPNGDQWVPYHCPVRADVRSRMNVPFRILSRDGSGAPSEDLEKAFLAEAETEARGMIQLKGHRSVGGLRASLYNALPDEAVDALVSLVREFARKHL